MCFFANSSNCQPTFFKTVLNIPISEMELDTLSLYGPTHNKCHPLATARRISAYSIGHSVKIINLRSYSVQGKFYQKGYKVF